MTVGATTPGGLLISGSPDPNPGAKLTVTEGVIIDVDASTGRATAIKRVKEPLSEEDNASD